MKIFWSVVALLTVTLGVLVWMPTDGSRDDASATPTTLNADQANTARSRDGSDGLPPSVASQPEAMPGPAVSERTESETQDSSDTGMRTAARDETPRLAEAPLAGDEKLASSEDSPADGADAPAQASVTWDDILGAITDEAPASADETALAAAITDESTGDDLVSAAAESEERVVDQSREEHAATAAAPELRELPDGTTLVNNRFPIAGDGSKARPYEVTWDYLTSARESYLPRDGKTEIPPHIRMLDGQYVKIGGYLQFPLATPEPKELLVMLNQWDGCCIGIPPTPYDAIEVSLATPATRGEKFAVEGSIVGRLKIDPYLVGEWLIGLYLIGDATLDVSGSRSAEEVYGNSPTMGGPSMPGG